MIQWAENFKQWQSHPDTCTASKPENAYQTNFTSFEPPRQKDYIYIVHFANKWISNECWLNGRITRWHKVK